MLVEVSDAKIQRFLERKFRLSKSHFTKIAYKTALRRFEEFLRIKYNCAIDQLIIQINDTKRLDPLDVLDEYYTYLAQYKKSDGSAIRNTTIVNYLVTAKEFLNSEGCKVYREDLQQKFRLPKIIKIYEKGLTKEIINRVLRFANPKLATAILIACASGMRIAEIIQLRISDIDFTTNPTTIMIRADTTKTRETRITHLTSEATKALKDYLARQNPPLKNDDYVFLISPEERLRQLKERLAKNDYTNPSFRVKDENRLPKLELQIMTMLKDELYAKSVKISRHNLESQLLHLLRNIPELNAKNENGRFSIHFHAFRAWFKTQVTDAHQSDFAEALMGHKSIKLVYYRQNDKTRAQTYLQVEHALTIADTEKIDKDFSELQKDNLELRGIVDSLSRQLRDLEKRIEKNNKF
jgi:integrase